MNEISALILTGGMSSRMNYQDKYLLKYDNRNFLEKIIDELEDFQEIIIAANSIQSFYQINFKDKNVKIVRDIYEKIGPIGGLYNGILNSSNEYIFVTTCDSPNITKNFINYILSFHTPDYDVLVVRCEREYINPLFGIYGKSCLDKLKSCIEDKEYKLIEVIKNLKIKEVSLKNIPFDGEQLLLNINTPDELNKI